MTRTIKLYGPPGTGKTRALTGLAIRSAKMYGPSRLAAITYTRAGATELKGRIARALDMTVPSDPHAAQRYLNNRLPWVGTIHSLCLRLTGGRVLDSLAEFMASQGSSATTAPSLDDLEGYTWTEPDKDGVKAALALWAISRQRMLPLDQAYQIMPWGIDGPPISLERAERIAAAYEDYKKQVDRIDFEDMLERGLQARLPVDVVLADEVQDNSPLLWQVVDHWADGLDTVLAGDPYQAIYLFGGADPRLFIDHPGEFKSLGDSWRLTPASAARAQEVLSRGGHKDEGWLGTWTGKGEGADTDGSVFYLARASALLDPILCTLKDDGVPFGYTRGGGPLSTKAARAYRGLARLQRSGALSLHELALIADQADKGYLPWGETARLKRLAKGSGDTLVSVDQLRERGWRSDLSGENLGFRDGAYLDRVYRKLGVGPFTDIFEPSVRVGTIHSAKGREADTVHLVDSWATLPYRSATDSGDGMRGEACVAYVGVTRHRARLNFIPGHYGSIYPGF